MPTKASKKTSKKVKQPTKATKKSSKTSSKTAALEAGERRFAGYPALVVFDKSPAKKLEKDEKKAKAVEQLLWGDYVAPLGPTEDGWVRVRTRHVKEGWVREEETVKDRLLEVIFVDIGQGDGSLVVTPDDKHILIDAGQGDNFIRFLRWRYPKFATRRDFEAIVISHPDADHYAGFTGLFKDDCPNVFVNTIYHNGIIERAAKTKAESLGPRAKDDGVTYLTDVVRDQARLEELLSDPAVSKNKDYPTMLKEALECTRVTNIRMLSAADGHMPGYGPGENKHNLTIKVLGPVIEPDGDGKARLRWFEGLSEIGPTKNGHSVVLRLQYGDVSMLLGGDLNIPSEKLLLGHHTGKAIPQTNSAEWPEFVKAAREVFQVDVAKSCHHGSADFSALFLEAVNPIATVISSGDEEPHAHPRSDTLGTIGRFSRGVRPLIFSTELSRSASEAIKHPNIVRNEFLSAQKKIEEANDKALKAKTPAAQAKAVKAKERAMAAFQKLVIKIQRSIGTYGAVNVRTDGKRVVIAYKIESATKKNKMWDSYLLEPENGSLRFHSKHEEE